MKELYEVNQNELILKLAELLKESGMKMPEWAKFVKTGANAEKPPLQKDWWYIRAAAILRTLYLKGPVGTSKLRRKYGGKRNCGAKPERVYLASGKIIRTILQQLEKMGLARFKDAGVRKGRIATSKGVELIMKAAKEVKKASKGK